ncbi:hypothetical protein sscle_02g018470 [Sclerotinia sclerotiorum 1980 UF-70]|uniref:F-box domain-containing protein n=1 Tax=Sclerotinia sclerotiorum (strain ATCC 18683 / 1980 / Ss-1) TaxID=665079 RepID=A0A1D9PWK7_SCLS1|nr:hypothetical protein sscle_02g018470 [Sclerotinia sclerotiorum 1980 UF-70]
MSSRSASIYSISSVGSEKQLAETSKMEKTAFERLPEDIIIQILLLTNANTFASLVLLNSRWRGISQQAYLYSHQLTQCPSYSAAHNTIPALQDEDSLPHLRALFAREIKRNLFEVYLRPQETVINLVSTSIGSSSAPGGEACHFSISPRGVLVLAYNSSRIHIIDVTAPEVHIVRELKILRRPAATTITDDGSMLAVLSNDLQVNLYDLTARPPKHIRSVALDHTPRTIALSPTGQVLAAAYDSGVELTSLREIGTSRAVKAYGVDSLTFSHDSDLLLGTTLQSRNPSTVVLTAPYYDPGSLSPEDSVSALWTTSILFPNGSRDCSHAVILPSPHDDETSWTFTYDRVFETFRAVRMDDLRNGKVHFVGPNGEPPASKAAANKSGDLAAVGYSRGSIWLWGIPENLDPTPAIVSSNSNAETAPGTPLSQIGRRNSAPSLRSVNRSLDHSNIRIPQWQLLCDKSRNTFVEGYHITTLDGVSALSWVQEESKKLPGERLVAVAPGVKRQCIADEDDSMSPVDGGRICILDFVCGPNNGRKTTTTIEVGQREDPEILEEEHRDLDTEVAIVRRRTVAQRRSYHASLARSTTTTPHSEPPPIPAPHNLGANIPLPPLPRQTNHLENMSDPAETASIDDDQEAFDDPYANAAPRSGTTLRRAATAAAVNRRLHPRSMIQEHIEYRRADGREEYPHESDADNWEPPPPPYQKDPVPPLPEHIQRSILADHARSLQRANIQRATVLDFPGLDAPVLQRPLSEALREQRYPFRRSLSDTTTAPSTTNPGDDEVARPMTSPSSANFDERPTTPDFNSLYDVSPIGTPQPTLARSSSHRTPRGSEALNNDDSNTTDLTSNSAMRATLQSPVSPIPQPMDVTLDRRLLDWETTTVDDQVSIMQNSRPTTVLAEEQRDDSPPLQLHSTVTEPQILAQEPSEIAFVQQSSTFPRMEDSTSNPVNLEDSTDEHFPIRRRSDSAPMDVPVDSAPAVSGLVLPSADLLARFNSRSGRPASLKDPSRRRSGSNPRDSIPLQNFSYKSQKPPHAAPEQSSRPSTSPSHAPASADKSSLLRPNTALHPPSRHDSPQRINPGSQRYSASPNILRPSMQRLETIHSATSTSGSPPYNIPPIPITRQPSRAERSAAQNVKNAKRKGWRKSMTTKKAKHKSDAASSAGWTDVTSDSRPATSPATVVCNTEVQLQQKKHSAKCMVM